MPLLLPSALIALITLSILFAIAAMTLSVFSFEMLSMILGLFCGMMTLIYHATMFIWTYKRSRRSPSPSTPLNPVTYFTTTGTVSAYTLMGMWLLSVGVSGYSTTGPDKMMMPMGMTGTAFDMPIQAAGSAVSGVGAIIAGVIGIYTTRVRRREELVERADVEDKLFYSGGLKRSISLTSSIASRNSDSPKFPEMRQGMVAFPTTPLSASAQSRSVPSSVSSPTDDTLDQPSGILPAKTRLSKVNEADEAEEPEVSNEPEVPNESEVPSELEVPKEPGVSKEPSEVLAEPEMSSRTWL